MSYLYAKPDYRKGDVLVGAEGSGIARDVAFVAEYDPSEKYGDGTPTPGRWFFCFERAARYRKATVADLDTGIQMVEKQIAREQKRLDDLKMLREMLACAVTSSPWE